MTARAAAFGVWMAVLSVAGVSGSAPAAPMIPAGDRPVRLAAAEPYPPYPPAPPRRRAPVYPVPPPPVVAHPPPLSPLTRALYAPFWAAGLVVRYGFYYVVVAPLEVFARTVSYGPEGGVERPRPRSEQE
jgi:hypothetical protein